MHPSKRSRTVAFTTVNNDSNATVIGRREAKNDPKLLELNRTDLTNSTISIIIALNLSQSNLSGAKLDGAKLLRANLRNANLRNADLRGSRLKDADLRNADLRNADLRNANLNFVNLRGANLKGAEGITLDQIKQAKNWQEARYDPDLRQQLGLPPEKP